MKIYITGLPSGYEVEHLVRLFYPMAPLTLTPPEEGEDCVWAEKKEDSLYAMVREQGQSRDAAAPLPRPVEAGGETVEFTLASLTYDLLRSWTGIRPPWGKMTGVRPVRLIHDKRAAGWSETDIDHFFLERFDCSEQKYQMAKAIADLQEPILKVGSAPKTYSLYIGIPFCPSICLYCSFGSHVLSRWEHMVDPYLDALIKELIFISENMKDYTLDTIYIGGGTPTTLNAAQMERLLTKVTELFPMEQVQEFTVEAGRPDTINKEVLKAIRKFPVTRISINPQTMNQETLDLIGRHHTVEEIEEHNILGATFLAMNRAIAQLSPQPALALIDGNRNTGIAVPSRCIVGGDGKCADIAAASVLAKVTRDRYMRRMAETYPQYGFEKHKGYGTAAHYAAIREHGPCPIHRPSFLKKMH